MMRLLQCIGTSPGTSFLQAIFVRNSLIDSVVYSVMKLIEYFCACRSAAAGFWIVAVRLRLFQS